MQSAQSTDIICTRHAAPHLTLRPYQVEAITAVEDAIARDVRRLLISLPTGCGKTIIFATLIHQRLGRSLILVHRDELIEQALEKLALVDPSLRVGVVKAGRNELNAQVVVASVQTLARKQRLEQMGTDFRTIIVDECHHSTAFTYEFTLEYLGCFDLYGPALIGVTATPERGDGGPLGQIFDEIVYQRSIVEMIPDYLSDLRGIQVKLAGADFNVLHVRGGDYRNDEIEEMMFTADAPEHVAHAYLEHAKGRKALLFTPTVALAHAMVDAFRAVGISSIEALDGKTSLEERRAILGRLRTGETTIVANCAVLIEGFDEPSIECIIIARPTRSRPSYTQMIGRGTRLYPGKQDCLVLDVVGATSRHDLITTNKLFSLSEVDLKERTVTEAVAEQDRITAEAEAVEAAHSEDLKRIARTVDIFHRRSLQWVNNAGQAFSLSLGNQGWLALRPDGDRWQVVQIPKNGAPKRLTQGLSLEYAQGVAEDYARQQGAGGLVNPRAQWRQRPLANYQKVRAKMKWLRIPITAGMTLGQASNLIDQAELRKRLAGVGEVSRG